MTPKLTGKKYERDYTLRRAVIVDIDGTVALHNGRGPYDFDNLDSDLPNRNVIDVIRVLRNEGYDLVFLSGRPSSHYQETLEWLIQRVGGIFVGPFMRTKGDTRDDTIVKAELFDKYVRGNWDVVGVFDDRNRVVRMWRDLGLTVFQVAEGPF